MNSSGTDPKCWPGYDPAEPKIDAVCLIPEISLTEGFKVGQPPSVHYQLKQLHLAFAKRFTHGYHVSPVHGLLTVQQLHEQSDMMFTDLPQEKRYLFLMALQQQLRTLMGDSRPCICLIGSVLSQAMRRMETAYEMPLAAMSQRQRRHWLEAAMQMSSEALACKLFGAPILYGKGSSKAADKLHT